MRSTREPTARIRPGPARTVRPRTGLGSHRSPGRWARRAESAERAWPVIVLATAGLIAYWVIVVLPGVTSNTGFLQTAGVGCGAGATWLLSQRHARG